MKKLRLVAVVLVLLCLAMVSFAARAGQSANYHLDWFVPLTSGGGGPTHSAHFAANVTIGQTAINASAGANYQAGLGYWVGILQTFLIHLPFISK